jgi:hypothetical protein
MDSTANEKIGQQYLNEKKIEVNFTISYTKNQLYIPNHPKST